MSIVDILKKKMMLINVEPPSNEIPKILDDFGRTEGASDGILPCCYYHLQQKNELIESNESNRMNRSV
jgi:hypothetical protein